MTDLPTLEHPCPDCPTDAERDAAHNAWVAWRDEETVAFEAWVAGRRAAGNMNAWDPDLWRTTDVYRALKDREPERLPETGCVECDGTGLRLTDAGRDLLEFMRRWSR